MRKQSPPPHLRTCVTAGGKFAYGLHRPHYRVTNLRNGEKLQPLGQTEDGRPHLNTANFPSGDIQEPDADGIYEIPNPFPFRGVTFIRQSWADQAATDPSRIAIDQPQRASLHAAVRQSLNNDAQAGLMAERVFANLPDPVKLAVAVTSNDPEDLVGLAQESCCFLFDEITKRPTGLGYTIHGNKQAIPRITNRALFEAVANNPHLPDDYKEVMLLRPGVQGNSEIVGEWNCRDSHVYEYLRRNSYIPWGHFAANMADDAVRYDMGALSPMDIQGLRHLYYQRTYTRLAEMLKIGPLPNRQGLSLPTLEQTRKAILDSLQQGDGPPLPFSAALWGWNYGFDYAPSGYRLHASHQQIHQQFALIPQSVPLAGSGAEGAQPAFACGDMVQDFVREFRKRHDAAFFDCYARAIQTNQRMDGKADGPASLVVYEDGLVMLMVPKAQTSQWELQLMTLAPVGNIVEADTAMRQALDRALFIAMRVLTAMGAQMITVIEYSKRFHIMDNDQHLLYAFLPRLPQSPGAFSEAQLRWINGHYPEDFALVCRQFLGQAVRDVTFEAVD